MPKSIPTDSPVTLDMVASLLPVFVSVSFRTRARRPVRIVVCLCWRFGASAASRWASDATLGQFPGRVDGARARLESAAIYRCGVHSRDAKAAVERPRSDEQCTTDADAHPHSMYYFDCDSDADHCDWWSFRSPKVVEPRVLLANVPQAQKAVLAPSQ